jgi:hypothetical protein
MFSFISQLIGCAQASPLSGPDFTQPMEKVIHIGHRLSIFYVMPGNHSQELNFDKIYQRDSSKSYQINPELLAKRKTFTWREFEFIDVGKWDYWGKKSQGPGGQLGSLRVDIGYSLLPKGADLVQHVKQSYEQYLNGNAGLNNKYRSDENGKAVSPDEYAERAISAPTEFKTTTIGGVQFFTWHTDREFDGYKNTPLIYYVLPVEPMGYLTFLFDSSISVIGQEMVIKQEQRIQQDINEFLSHISVKPL